MSVMRNFKRNAFVFIIALMSLSTDIYATYYYVSQSGNDSNQGSFNSPFKTINRGLKFSVPGDTVFVRSGTYVEKVWLLNSGTISNPISLLAYPGEIAIIDGGGEHPNHDYGALLNVAGDYINVSGFEIRNSNINGVWLGGYGIKIQGGQNRISNMNVHHCWSNGILINGDNCTVEDCRVWEISLENEFGESQSDWASALSAARNINDGITKNAIIRRNIVYNNWGEGISTYEAEGTIIEDNIVFDNWSVNLYVSDARNVLVQRNIIYNTTNNLVGRRKPLMLGDEQEKKPRSANNIIINNLLYNADLQAFWSTIPLGSGLDNVLIAHNTIINGKLLIGAKENSKVINKGAKIINNIFSNESGPACSETGSLDNLVFSHNLWSSTPREGVISSNDIIGDPGFINFGSILPGELTSEFFVLTKNSPAINMGSVMKGVSTDFFNTIRDSCPDIGGYEYHFGTSEILVYPNPSNGLFNILFNSKVGPNAELSIFNSEGKKIYSINKPVPFSSIIDISIYPPGLYIFKVDSDCNVFSGRLIKTDSL